LSIKLEIQKQGGLDVLKKDLHMEKNESVREAYKNSLTAPKDTLKKDPQRIKKFKPPTDMNHKKRTKQPTKKSLTSNS
jgi:uncharacterized UPF0146 family protein